MRAQPGTLRAAEWTAHAGQHAQAGRDIRSEGHAPLTASVLCCCRVDGRRSGGDAHQRLEHAPAAGLVLAAAVDVLDIVQLRLIFLQVRRNRQRRGHMLRCVQPPRSRGAACAAPAAAADAYANAASRCTHTAWERPAVATLTCRTSPDRRRPVFALALVHHAHKTALVPGVGGA
jgi:hypothetical protein